VITTGPRVGDDAIRLRLLVGEGRSGAWRESSAVRNPDGERKSRNKDGKLSFHLVRAPAARLTGNYTLSGYKAVVSDLFASGAVPCPLTVPIPAVEGFRKGKFCIVGAGTVNNGCDMLQVSSSSAKRKAQSGSPQRWCWLRRCCKTLSQKLVAFVLMPLTVLVPCNHLVV
jgi:hypothetical protein